MIPHDKFIDKIKQYIDEKKLFFRAPGDGV